VTTPPGDLSCVAHSSPLLSVLASAAAAAPVPKAVKGKAFDLDGRWVTAERVNKGNEIKEAWAWEIGGETLTIRNPAGDGTFRKTYQGTTTTFSRPDPTKPDEFDYRYSPGQGELVYRGRVQWDGDEWVFCFGEAGADRPTEVKAGKDVYYLRFKRMSDK
jgi:hypothetical protein